jgi:hypothetical protein
MVEPIHILSFGAGVQSSTMALMAAHGEITPMPVAAVFADTQAEPKSVYTWLDWLEKQLPFPVIRATKGSLEKRCLTSYYSNKNKKITFESIPAFLKNPDGSQSLIPRQCTRDYKVDVVTKAVNAKKRVLEKSRAILWIGISLDEIYRMKEHRNAPRIRNRWPLVELRKTRSDCLEWCKRRGFPEPPRSACYFCPYHSNREWRRMKQDEPGEFAKAVEFEKAFKSSASASSALLGEVFLHRSLKPLDQVDFSTEEDRGQLDMFNNECEGMCGL